MTKDSYLNLFGAKIPLTTKDGSTNLAAYMVQNIDETIKDSYRDTDIRDFYGNVETLTATHDMAVPGTKYDPNRPAYFFKYMGGDVKYNVTNETSGGILDWGTGKPKRIGGYFGPGKNGVHVIINRHNKTFDFVTWTFPNSSSYQVIKNRADDLFRNRTSYRKY